MRENDHVTGRGPGRPPETTHDEIRRVALALFVEHGYGATSLASIARAAGVSRTTLFAYFRSKRDLIWEDHDRRVDAMEDAVLADASDGTPVDLVLAAMRANANYTVGEHAVLATRLRIVSEDDELRAYGALTAQQATDRIVTLVAGLAPQADRHLLELVTRALVGASAQCTEEWAALDDPRIDLDAFTMQRIAPVADALRPLLA